MKDAFVVYCIAWDQIMLVVDDLDSGDQYLEWAEGKKIKRHGLMPLNVLDLFMGWDEKFVRLDG